MHKLTARYGLNLCDTEALWMQQHGTAEQMAEFQARRSAEFNEKVERAVGTKLSNMVSRDG